MMHQCLRWSLGGVVVSIMALLYDVALHCGIDFEVVHTNYNEFVTHPSENYCVRVLLESKAEDGLCSLISLLQYLMALLESPLIFAALKILIYIKALMSAH